MEVSVLSNQGVDTGRKVLLPSAVFEVEANQHIVYLAIKAYLANQRQGTHKTKEKSEVALSTRKLYRQKGTGNARAGSAKSPLRKGGGTIFGPQPRDYSLKMNKKERKMARLSLLSDKASHGAIRIIESFDCPPKTKAYCTFLEQLSLQKSKTLLVVPSIHRDLVLASRNIPRAQVVTVDHLNPYNIVRADCLLFMESVVPLLESRLL